MNSFHYERLAEPMYEKYGDVGSTSDNYDNLNDLFAQIVSWLEPDGIYTVYCNGEVLFMLTKQNDDCIHINTGTIRMQCKI